MGLLYPSFSPSAYIVPPPRSYAVTASVCVVCVCVCEKKLNLKRNEAHVFACVCICVCACALIHLFAASRFGSEVIHHGGRGVPPIGAPGLPSLSFRWKLIGGRR